MTCNRCGGKGMVVTVDVSDNFIVFENVIICPDCGGGMGMGQK